jgi:hypothetical protein
MQIGIGAADECCYVSRFQRLVAMSERSTKHPHPTLPARGREIKSPQGRREVDLGAAQGGRIKIAC